jgi:hypothetical protein
MLRRLSLLPVSVALQKAAAFALGNTQPRLLPGQAPARPTTPLATQPTQLPVQPARLPVQPARLPEELPEELPSIAATQDLRAALGLLLQSGAPALTVVDGDGVALGALDFSGVRHALLDQ